MIKPFYKLLVKQLKFGKMDELKNIAPKLSEIKKENPFGVPPCYFDNFSARLQVKIEAERAIVYSPENRIIQFLKPALSLAASLALICLLAYFPLTYKNEQLADNTNQDTELTDETYISLFEGMDDNSLYELFSESVFYSDYSDDEFDEELLAYLSLNLSDYDIYNNMEFDF